MLNHPANKHECPRRVVAIVGPTATGKTALGVHVARQLNSEVISADSQLLYRYLNIGTAKPTSDECQGVPHHMIDVSEPNAPFSAGMYQEQATAHLKTLWDAGKIPVVVGGTGFYLRALLQETFIPEIAPNEPFRAHLKARVSEEGSPVLHAELAVKDPRRAQDLHPNDAVRLIRALEIIEATGLPVPQREERHDLDVLWCGLTYEDRAQHDARIDGRIQQMLNAGWMDEIQAICAQYGVNAHALGVAHGYPELLQVLNGERTLEDAVSQIQINIHQYSRRQMTWFRRNSDIRWWAWDSQSSEMLIHDVNEHLSCWLKKGVFRG